jgi:hypothetical protein
VLTVATAGALVVVVVTASSQCVLSPRREDYFCVADAPFAAVVWTYSNPRLRQCNRRLLERLATESAAEYYSTRCFALHNLVATIHICYGTPDSEMPDARRSSAHQPH